MALEPDTSFGNYQVGEVIGEGGMGQVFRATDTTLEREVAIKVLPESFARDTDRVARFEREAKTLASLNHPNIAQIYGLEKQGEDTAIVMELVEGPTLADRIAEGALEPEEAMRIAMQLVDGLEAAHERGVVHRDLKPANIKIKQDGLVKILDFGIAKAIDFKSASGGGQTPTMMTPAVTETGIIMGTAAYMSPEQARGKFVDQRTDVWAFGCVLYEMLTGQPAFAGEDVAVTLARIIANDTDMDSIPGAISPLVRHTLAMCLQKEPKNRIHHIGDVRLAIKGDFEIGVGKGGAAGRAGMPWAAAAVLFAVITGAAAWLLKPVPEQEAGQVVRFDFALDEQQVLQGLGRNVVDISWDGRQIIYNTIQGLFMRNLDDNEGRLIPGTTRPMNSPLFSPDGEWIAFYDGQLKKIPKSGGSAVVLAEIPNPQGASWHPDGSSIIVGVNNEILAVPANGGEPETLLTVDGFAWNPQILPNGDLIYTLAGSAQPEIHIRTPGSDDSHVTFPGERAIYTPTGHLIVTDPAAAPNALFARTINLDTYELGGPVPITENVAFTNGKTHYAISNAGHLVSLFGTGGVSASGTLPDLEISIVNREGDRQVLGLPPRPYRNPRVSPDGSQLAVEIRQADDSRSSIWIWDMSGQSDIRRLTQVTEGDNERPVWTLDSQQITFMSDRDGPGSIYMQPANGSRPAVRLTTAEEGTIQYPESWAPDGSLSFSLLSNEWDVYTRDPEGEISAFNALDANQYTSSFSPDGKWLAYSSVEEGTSPDDFRIFVERYPKTGERYEVAVDGAFNPVFTSDGSEIFYRRGWGAAARTMNSVSILETEPRFRFSSSDSVEISGFINHTSYRDFDPMPDGSGLVILTPEGGGEIPATANGTDATLTALTTAQRFNVVLNWFEELKQRVPTE